jgi:hypothetical protein
MYLDLYGLIEMRMIGVLSCEEMNHVLLLGGNAAELRAIICMGEKICRKTLRGSLLPSSALWQKAWV